MQLDYEAAVAYLTEKPEEIKGAWNEPSQHIAGALFAFVRPNNVYETRRPDGGKCGCLSMIRGGDFVAWDDHLTLAIRSDERLPRMGWLATVAQLKVFRDWQTYLDSAIRGVDPTGVEFCPIVLDLARKAGAWLPPEATKRELPSVILDSVNWQLVFSSEKKLAATAD